MTSGLIFKWLKTVIFKANTDYYVIKLHTLEKTESEKKHL